MYYDQSLEPAHRSWSFHKCHRFYYQERKHDATITSASCSVTIHITNTGPAAPELDIDRASSITEWVATVRIGHSQDLSESCQNCWDKGPWTE